MQFFQISLKNGELKTTHNTLQDYRVHFSDNVSQNSCININIDDNTSGTEDSQSHTQFKCECVKKVSMELLSNTNFSLLVYSI